MTNDSATSLAATLARVDLNLMLALDALLRERSVTRAAQALGLSQPALSSSLAKLRRYFRDDLLIRVGNNYELTPMAVFLAERTSDAMAAAGKVFGTQENFDPVTSDREFTLYLSDYAISVLSAPLSRLTRAQAPGVRIRILQQSHRLIEEATEILRDSDGILLPHGFISDARSIDLFTDRFVCLVATENDTVGDSIELDQLARMPMVVAFHSSRASAAAVMQLRLAGVEPWIDIATESFLAVPGVRRWHIQSQHHRS